MSIPLLHRVCRPLDSVQHRSPVSEPEPDSNGGHLQLPTNNTSYIILKTPSPPPNYVFDKSRSLQNLRLLIEHYQSNHRAYAAIMMTMTGGYSGAHLVGISIMRRN